MPSTSGSPPGTTNPSPSYGRPLPTLSSTRSAAVGMLLQSLKWDRRLASGLPTFDNRFAHVLKAAFARAIDERRRADVIFTSDVKALLNFVVGLASGRCKA